MESSETRFYEGTVPNIVAIGQFVPIIFEATGKPGDQAVGFFQSLCTAGGNHILPAFRSTDSLMAQIQIIIAKVNAQMALYHLRVNGVG
jgi:hypothetical protein